MLHVLLDSNIYRQDLTLDRLFRVLFTQARNGGFRIVLPEVVTMEVERLFQDAVEAANKEHEGARRRLESLEVAVPQPTPIDFKAATQAFRQRLENRLTDSGGLIAPIPDVPHSELVRKAGRTYVPAAGQGPPGHRANDPMFSIVWPSMRPEEVLDPGSAALDYRYDSLPISQ